MKTILADAINSLFIKNNTGSTDIFMEMKNMLDSFSNSKIVLTNADEQEFNKFNLHTSPYEIFTLSHNPNKTSPEYYRLFLEKNNLQAQDVVYFEHNMEAVESARSLGINTYWYNPEVKDVQGVKNFLEGNINK